MNLYDFDNTIFKGDSSVKFIKYSFLRHPFLVLFSIIKAIPELIILIFNKDNLGNVKSKLFSFVKYIKDLDDYVDKYVLKNLKNIKKFYIEKQDKNDVVISASFDFIIKPFCKYLKINNVIASEYDIKKGCIIGTNCKGEEKVKRYKEIFKNREVNYAYSDSLSDIPMLNLAKIAYIVKDEELILYKKNDN